MSDSRRAGPRPGAAGPLRSQRGNVAVNLAIVAVALIAMVALGVEITFLLLKHRQMQSAADSGAIAAAAALGAGASHDVLTLEADAVAAKTGVTAGVGGTTVTVNNPPSKGPNTTNANAVEVIIVQPQALGLAKVVHSGLFTIKARAVAVTSRTGKFCILALDPTAAPAVLLENNADITNPDCGVVSNSSASNGIQLDNGSSISGQAYSHGGIQKGTSGVTIGSEKTDQPTVADPYAGVTPTPGACTGQSGNISNGKTVSLTPGHFCSGWTTGNNATLNLAPGQYYIDSVLSLGNGVTINGTGGVTLVINGNYAISWGGHDILNLKAPTSGTFEGLAIYSPATNSPSITQVFWNNLLATIDGALYFPSQPFLLRNNGTVNATTCTQIIARTVDLRNNVSSDNLCAKGITAGASSALVE